MVCNTHTINVNNTYKLKFIIRYLLITHYVWFLIHTWQIKLYLNSYMYQSVGCMLTL